MGARGRMNQCGYHSFVHVVRPYFWRGGEGGNDSISGPFMDSIENDNHVGIIIW